VFIENMILLRKAILFHKTRIGDSKPNYLAKV